MIRLNQIRFVIGIRGVDLIVQGKGIFWNVFGQSFHEEGKVPFDELIGSDHRGQFAYDVWRKLSGFEGYPPLIAAFVCEMQEARLKGLPDYKQLEADWNEIYRLMCAIDELVQMNR